MVQIKCGDCGHRDSAWAFDPYRFARTICFEPDWECPKCRARYRPRGLTLTCFLNLIKANRKERKKHERSFPNR